jgi:hypothetical protein
MAGHGSSSRGTVGCHSDPTPALVIYEQLRQERQVADIILVSV